MMIIEGNAGEHIEKAAVRLCAVADTHGSATLKFNSLTLIASRGDTPDKVLHGFDEPITVAQSKPQDEDVLRALVEALAGRDVEIRTHVISHYR